MYKTIYTVICCCVLWCSKLYASNDPWFTGPLIALSGKAVALGEIEAQTYGFYTSNDGLYDANWHFSPTSEYINASSLTQFSHGLAKGIDVEYDIPYSRNVLQGKSYSGLGDVAIVLGLQLLEQNNSKSKPNLRLTVQETFPTGRYNDLSASSYNVAALGAGSYQTTLGLNFELLSQFNNGHYLNSHLCLFYNLPSDVRLHGLSTYGGTPGTNGTISPGNSFTLDIAEEYTLTQHWVAVFEGIFVTQQASTFVGHIGPTQDIRQYSNPDPRRFIGARAIARLERFPNRFNIGGPGIGNGNTDELSLAPALEYNFSDNIGVIGGFWFTVMGKNNPSYESTVISLTVSW